jgi:hypothetical protein
MVFNVLRTPTFFSDFAGLLLNLIGTLAGGIYPDSTPPPKRSKLPMLNGSILRRDVQKLSAEKRGRQPGMKGGVSKRKDISSTYKRKEQRKRTERESW